MNERESNWTCWMNMFVSSVLSGRECWSAGDSWTKGRKVAGVDALWTNIRIQTHTRRKVDYGARTDVLLCWWNWLNATGWNGITIFSTFAFSFHFFSSLSLSFFLSFLTIKKRKRWRDDSDSLVVLGILFPVVIYFYPCNEKDETSTFTGIGWMWMWRVFSLGWIWLFSQIWVRRNLVGMSEKLGRWVNLFLLGLLHFILSAYLTGLIGGWYYQKDVI